MFLKISIIILAYLLGSIPSGYLIFRITQKGDIRSFGSGNIGATNVARAMGTKGGLLTLFLDIAKGAGAVLLARYLLNPNLAAAAGVMAIIGHNSSIFLKFKGGKGVATALGVFFSIAAKAILPSLGIFIIMLIAFKYVSLGSISAAASFPLFTLLFHYPKEIIIAAVLGGMLIIIAHRSNIRRLIKGKENKISLGRKKRG